MEPQVNRETVRTEQGGEQGYVVEQTPPPLSLDRTDTVRTFMPHAIAAGLLAVAMLVWGGVTMLRADFGDDLREPVVEVFGISGNALSGMIVAAVGILLLLAAVSRDRGPVVFLTVVAGVAAVIAAIEPGTGDTTLGIGRGLPTAVAIGCAVVLLVALAAPTVDRRTHSVEQH